MKELHESYAEALFEVAEESGITDTVLTELGEVAFILESNPDYLSLLDSPTVQTGEKISMIDKAFTQANGYLLNFIKILIENKCVSEISKIKDYFSAIYDEKHGILRATAVSAIPLNREQADKIKASLEARTGKSIVLTNTVDPSIIGGIRLDFGTEQIDKSVSSSLRAIGTLISDTDI